MGLFVTGWGNRKVRFTRSSANSLSKIFDFDLQDVRDTCLPILLPHDLPATRFTNFRGVLFSNAFGGGAIFFTKFTRGTIGKNFCIKFCLDFRHNYLMLIHQTNSQTCYLSVLH